MSFAGVIYQVQQLINMPLIPPSVVSSASDYHALSLSSVQNSATTSVPLNATNSGTNNVNDILHNNLINNNSNNTVISNNNGSNNTNDSGENLIGNSTIRDGDSNGNIVNEEATNITCNSPLITSLQCNILTSHEPISTSTSAVNGNTSCISEY